MQTRTIKSIKRSPAPAQTYNIATANRNYFAAGVLVHNCDDPIKMSDIHSPTTSESVISWWDEEMSTRGADPARSSFVIIMQRGGVNDLAGHVLKQGGYEHLCLPSEFELAHRCSTSIGWSDPRQSEGELLFPAMFPQKVLDEFKTKLGSFAYAAQFQQRPVPREGGMLKYDWFQRYTIAPAHFELIVQSWDTAQKAKELSAPWVCSTWGILQGKYYLLNIFRKQMGYPEGKKIAKQMLLDWEPVVTLIEDKSTGSSLIQELQLEGVDVGVGRPRYFNILAIEPDADKLTRISTESPAIEAGRVFLPVYADWLSVYEGEMTSIPNAVTMDQCDSTSQFLKWVRTHEWMPSIESADEESGARGVLDRINY
jgi:predicted phage terminase large subunit-like protein